MSSLEHGGEPVSAASIANDGTFYVVAASMSRAGFGPYATREEAEQNPNLGGSYWHVYEIKPAPAKRSEEESP